MTDLEEQRTLVVLSPDGWHALLRGQQQIAGRLSDRYRVVFIEPGRRLGSGQVRSALASLPALWRRAEPTPVDGVEVVAGPPQIPAFRTQLPRAVLRWSFPLTAKLNLWIGRSHLRRLYRSAEISDPILMSWGFGHIGTEVHQLFDDREHCLSCYVVYDEQAEFVHNQLVSRPIAEADARATASADLVLATSPSQFERRGRNGANVHFMPNGVDFELFADVPEPSEPVSRELIDLPGPIIGYAGWMGYQLDLKLLGQVADAYPDGSVVLVGPDHLPNSHDADTLRRKPNVHLLGRREPHELAALMHQFDVAMLPYVLEGHTRSIYPLKLHEYLAAGRSIVATHLPNLEQHSDVITICESTAEFVQRINVAAQDHGPEAIEKRVETARTYSWDARANQVDELLTQLLSARPR